MQPKRMLPTKIHFLSCMLILIGAVGKLFADGMEFQASDARVRQLEDGRIETQTAGELFRQRNG